MGIIVVFTKASDKGFLRVFPGKSNRILRIVRAGDYWADLNIHNDNTRATMKPNTLTHTGIVKSSIATGILKNNLRRCIIETKRKINPATLSARFLSI